MANRNINSIKQTNGFIAMSPEIATQWSNPKMAKTRSGTGRVGKIIPVFLRSMTPGEKFKMKQSGSLQFMPFMSNLFHEIDGEIDTFFIPDRLSTFRQTATSTTANKSMTSKYVTITGDSIGTGYQANEMWENFITGGITGEPTTNASSLPKMNLKNLYDNATAQDSNGNKLVETLADYFCMPIKGFDSNYDNPVNSRLWHAYNYTYNEYYRNPDFTAERNLDDNTVATAYWESDRFTHARKQQLRGTVPSVPLSDEIGRIFELQHEISIDASANQLNIETAYSQGSTSSKFGIKAEAEDNTASLQGTTGLNTTPSGSIYAIINNHSLSNIGINLNDLLTNLAIMKYETNNERMRPYYKDQLYYRFGITNQDVRLDKPELIGKVQIGIGVETVTQTSAGGSASPTSQEDSYQGNITSQGWGNGGNEMEYEIKEHGIMMSLMIIRPKGVYEGGVDKPWQGDIDRYDFITPELVDIPDVLIEKQELKYTGNKEHDKAGFGYEAIYETYRTMPNEVCGWLRPSIIGGLGTYTLARYLPDNVELNEDFLKCNPEMNRIKQFTGDNVPDFIFFIRTELKMAQPLPLINNPTTIM